MDKEFISWLLVIISIIGFFVFLHNDYTKSQNYIRQHINKHPECATAKHIHYCIKVLEEANNER